MTFAVDKKAGRPESSTTISSDDVTANRDQESNVACGGDLMAERPEQGSNMAAFFNIVCVVAGTGTLGLPYSLAKGGWIGVGILILSMIMSIYTGILIMKCIYYNGHTRLASYQEIGQHAFGRIGLIAVWFFHTSIVLGAPIMYFILSGTEIRELTVAHVNIPAKAWIWICCGVVSIPFVLMKSLKEVSLLSIFGVVATAVLVGVTMVESGLDYKNHKDTIQYDAAILRNLPIAVATISVCFGGNVVYMHVEESMRYPRSWNKVLVWAMLACCLMYAMVAVPGYLTYGPSSESPILKSLPQGTSRKVATIMIVAHVLLAAPVLMTSFALEVERVFDISIEKRGVIKERLYRTVTRLIIMGAVGGIACLVPFFDSFLSLLGALGNCMLIYVLPIFFYWRLIGWRQMPWYELLWCAIILIIGLLGCVIGSIDAIKALHHDFTYGRPE
ncbi:transmembrane amino acid transporter protein-domain-containing protein [Linnemannia elongata]|nr:transmembrane amino acid transporter protein-domain-containing protein [Linnemannia elongata]